MSNTDNKTEEQLKRITTKRLLAYYKAERKRMIKFKNGHTCDCCGIPDWEMKPNDYTRMLKKQYFDKLSYLETIKRILNTKEHVIDK